MKIYPIISVCLIVVISFILLSNVNKSIKTRYFKAFDDAKTIARNLMSDDSSTDNVDIRLRIWEDALNKFKKNPARGSGFGMSYHDKISGKTWVHPHNIILEILTEIGIVGFSIFLILFGLIFARGFFIFRQTSGTDRLTFFFYPLSLFFFFLFSLLHTDLSTEYFKWYFAGIITGFDTSG